MAVAGFCFLKNYTAVICHTKILNSTVTADALLCFWIFTYFVAFQLNLLEKSLAFISIIHSNTKDLDATIVKSFDELGLALAQRFPNLIDYAQPAEFWNKYRKKTTTKSKTKKRKSTADEINDENVHSDLSGSGSDDEDNIPIATAFTTKKCMRNNCSELPMEYLFNPNIVL